MKFRIRIADKIVLLDHGEVIEKGSPDKLLREKDSRFFQIYSSVLSK